jgi:hypothetical protein
MRRPTDKSPATAEKAEFPRRKSGRASFDADGRSIWEWQTATGVFERNATAEQLAKLEDTTLSIVEEAPPPTGLIYDSTAPAQPRTRAVRKAPSKPTESTTVLSRLLKRFGRH